MTDAPETTMNRTLPLSALVATAMVAACTSMGSGAGTLTPGGNAVAFAWDSKDGGITGDMSAVLSDGAKFSGPFVQITSPLEPEELERSWPGWNAGWKDWYYPGYWGQTPESAPMFYYSGKVLASLKGPSSQQLRCHFHLNQPDTGMRGGGEGQCQLTGGQTISATFARA